MPDFISAQIDDKQALKGLAQLVAQGKNLRPVMAAIGNVLVASTEENFRQEGRYSTPESWRGGTNKWKELEDSTVKRREKLGRSDHPILQVRGDMAATFSQNVEVTNNSVTIGTNKVQAHALHYGFDSTVTVKGHTRTRNGKSYNVKSFSRKMKLPPRPIIAVQDDDIKEINDLIGKHLLGTWVAGYTRADGTAVRGHFRKN